MASLQEQIITMKALLETAETEVNSLQNGRKASSARARKSLQSIKTNAHTLRKSITEAVKSMPTKSRSKKPEPTEPGEPTEPTEPAKKVKVKV